MEGRQARVARGALAGLLVACVCLAGCRAAIPSPTSSPTPKATVVVRTEEELFAALQSGTTIRLMPGRYDMGKSKASTNPHVSYDADGLPDEFFSPTGTVLSDLSDVTLEAEGTSADVLLFSSAADDNVLIFDHCSNIDVSNVSIGHSVDPAEVCSACVVYLNGSTHMRFTGCDVFGCGTSGFTLNACDDVRVGQSTIRNCLYAAFYMLKTTDTTFEDTTIRNNGNTIPSSLFVLFESTGISLVRCAIRDNGTPLYLAHEMVESDPAGEPKFTDCSDTGNSYLPAGTLLSPAPTTEAEADPGYAIQETVYENGTFTYHEVTDLDAYLKSTDQPVFLDFWASWCGFCVAATPFVEQLAEEYAGRVHFIRVDVDQAGAVASAYSASSIPQFNVVKSGSVVGTQIGYGAELEGAIRAMVEKALK